MIMSGCRSLVVTGLVDVGSAGMCLWSMAGGAHGLAYHD
jgi:hypothetical protein